VRPLPRRADSDGGAARAAGPLRLHAAPAVPILQYNPKFEESWAPEQAAAPRRLLPDSRSRRAVLSAVVGGQDGDLDRERAEKRKLKRQHHKELKGAVRELRKDNAFLAGEQAEQLKRQRKIRDERWVRPIRRRGVFVRAG
jgi:hypothetical protein